MKRVTPWLPAVGIFCLAMLVRVIYNNTVAFQYYPLHDSLKYQILAHNLLAEHCFCVYPYISTVYRPPLWPFLMAGVSLLFGPGDYVARISLSVIGSGTCVLIYLFARDLFGWRIGVLAGIAASVYPELYIYDGWLYTESLYIFLLFAVCYGLYRLQRSPTKNWRLWITCGILLGLLSLTRPNGIIVIGLFIVWAIIMAWQKLFSWRVTTRGVLTTTLMALALIAPWTVRNYLVSHTFIPVATGDGTVLLGAYNDDTLNHTTYQGGPKGTWINPLESRPDISHAFPISTCTPQCEVTREETYKDGAVQWIQNHTSIMPHLLKLHFLNMWQPDTYEADLPTVRFPQAQFTQLVISMMKTFPIYLFILAAFGFAVTWWRWSELLFIYFMIVLTIALNIFYYGIPRFRAPIEPMLILLAAGAIWWVTQLERGTLRWIIKQARNRFQSDKELTGTSEHSLAPRESTFSN